MKFYYDIRLTGTKKVHRVDQSEVVAKFDTRTLDALDLLQRNPIENEKSEKEGQ
jgi:hypothetical protein